MFLKALRLSVARRPKRFAIAVLAVTVGVGMAIALVSVSLALGDKLAQTAREYGANLMVLPAGADTPLEVAGTDATSDLSRRHAILTSATGVTTVVGGKLTTYRRMAQDTLDALVAAGRLDAGPCRTASVPLLGAARPDELRRSTAPARLVRRFGTDADLVLASAREVTGLADDELLAPVSGDVAVTLAELVFAVTHEGAHDVDDLLDRRTRVGLVREDRAAAVPLAERALALTRT